MADNVVIALPKPGPRRIAFQLALGWVNAEINGDREGVNTLAEALAGEPMDGSDVMDGFAHALLALATVLDAFTDTSEAIRRLNLLAA